MLKTYYFDTGVKYSNYPYLCKHEIVINNVKHICFEVEEVPKEYMFIFAMNDYDKDSYNDDHFLIREIQGGGLLSKYAYFKKMG